LCGYFEVSRSGYYKAGELADKKLLNEQLVLSLIHDVRRRHPRIGGKKLYFLLSADLKHAGIKLGRDKFFELLSRNVLLVKRHRKYISTTDSYHRFRVYRNLLKGKKLQKAHRGWVSDITYIRTQQEFVYLFLITDAYSRKIVGWDLSDSLKITGAVQALKMAARQCPATKDVIHHSDPGYSILQQGIHQVIEKGDIRISMTEENHCYENATAERVNGILKQEYGLDETFSSEKNAARAVKEAIWSYNMDRPHWSLNLATPQQVHLAA